MSVASFKAFFAFGDYWGLGLAKKCAFGENDPLREVFCVCTLVVNVCELFGRFFTKRW